MFDIGWGELLVVGVIALIAIGPKELPSVLRALGQWTGKIRRMANEFQDQFRDALREAEMDDLKKQVDELNTAATDITSYDPVGDLSKDFETGLDDKPAEDNSSTGDKPASDTIAAADERPDPVESVGETAAEPAASTADEKDHASTSTETAKTAGAGGRPA